MTSPWERMSGNRAPGRWSEARTTPVIESDDESCGYVLHVPIAVSESCAAVDVGRAVVAVLSRLPTVEVGSAAISEEGRLDRHQALCCNRRLVDDARCLLPPRHAAGCDGAPWRNR